jgi:hypothetical protein
VLSPEMQDVEPIHLASMSGAATSSRGGTELLADDLVDPVELPLVLSTQLIYVFCCRTSRRGPDKSLKCFMGTATRCSGSKP